MKEYCVETSGYSPATTTKPAPVVRATRLKGEDIIEMRPHVVGQKSGKIVLELTPYAAEVLRALVGLVCGPDTGPRGQTEQIYFALSDAGVRPAHLRAKSGFSLSNIWIQ